MSCAMSSLLTKKILRVSICNCADVSKKLLFLTVRMSPFLACCGRLSIVRPFHLTQHLFDSSSGEKFDYLFLFWDHSRPWEGEHRLCSWHNLYIKYSMPLTPLLDVNLCHSLKMVFSHDILLPVTLRILDFTFFFFLQFLSDSIASYSIHTVHILLDFVTCSF